MIRKYVRHKKGLFGLFFSVLAILPLVQYAYSARMEPVLYGLSLVSFLFLLGILIDSQRFYKKHRILKEIREHRQYYPQNLPPARDDIEEEYQGIIDNLIGIIQEESEKSQEQKKDMEEYFTMWVHQIKTPIAAMNLLLQDGGEQKNQGEMELFKIGQYVDMALDYTRMGNLSSDLMIREYLLDDIIKESVKKCATIFIYKKISIEVQETNITLATDSKWLSFILEQLLTNAVKYTTSGKVSIMAKDNVLTIEDTGIGIRKEDLNRIFEKGFTGYNGRLDKNASGIGLYMVKTVADSLNIGISVFSTLGEGTVISLTLPKNDGFLPM